MNRVDSALVKIFMYGLTVVIIFTVFSYSYNTGIIDHATPAAKLFNNITGFVYASWMAISVVLSIRLMFSGSFRDLVLSRLTFIRERDEREVMLTGKATRTTFLTTLAILIFLFCLSCFQVTIYRVPSERAIDGKDKVVTLGVSFILRENRKQAGTNVGELRNKDIFTYSGLPVSSTAIILGLIIWQISSYNFTMRRMIRKQ